jgi:hypothetical protein
MRLVELLGQKAEARYDGGPPPALRVDLKHLYRKYVSRLGAVDMNRPSQGIDPRPVYGG